LRIKTFQFYTGIIGCKFPGNRFPVGIISYTHNFDIVRVLADDWIFLSIAYTPWSRQALPGLLRIPRLLIRADKTSLFGLDLGNLLSFGRIFIWGGWLKKLEPVW
jgi:hypothetical protein